MRPCLNPAHDPGAFAGDSLQQAIRIGREEDLEIGLDVLGSAPALLDGRARRSGHRFDPRLDGGVLPRIQARDSHTDVVVPGGQRLPVVLLARIVVYQAQGALLGGLPLGLHGDRIGEERRPRILGRFSRRRRGDRRSRGFGLGGRRAGGESHDGSGQDGRKMAGHGQTLHLLTHSGCARIFVQLLRPLDAIHQL